MRRLLELLLIGAVAACGGKIDDGTDASVDAGSDASSDVIMKPDTSPPPTCSPDSFPCTSASACCSKICSNGTCGLPPPPPPPPPCKPDGTACASDVECCSNVCNGTCGVQVACATTSTKKCDQCIAANCCKPYLDCGNDSTCSTWLGCVQNCEQQNQSAFTCSTPQSQCGGPQNTTENALFKCGQQFCQSPCSVD